MFKRLNPLLNMIAAVFLVFSLTHWFPMGINVLELLGSFAPFTLAFSLVIFLASVLFRFWMAVGLSAVSTILCAMLLLPHFSFLQPSEKGILSIGQFNLYHGNKLAQKAFSELNTSDVDILIVQELNTRWMFIADSILGKKYPFNVTEPWHDCCYGIGLYSKFRILESEVLDLEGTPAIRATMEINGHKLTVITLHTRPPIFPNETKERNLQLKTVAEIAQQITEPLIVIGDLNVVPWDATFNTFLRSGNLQAVRNGFQATFPMEFGIPIIPIDHITYSTNLTPTACETMKISGSDHKGIIGTFLLH